MKSIIKFSVYHPVSVLMVIISFIICSCICIGIIQVDFLPKMQDRFLIIHTEYPGLPADQMKKLVSVPVEDSSASIKGIKNTTSVTRDGISLVQIELHWSADIDIALAESRQIIDQCYEILPNGCSKPNVRIFNPYAKETVKLVVSPKDNNLEYARYITLKDFKPRFQRLEGVASVNVYGGNDAEIQIIPDKTKIESYGLDLTSISQIINFSNFEYPAGNVVEGNKKYTFKTDGLLKSLDDFRNIPVSLNQNTMFKIKDIAEVKEGIQTKQSFYTYMGNECISIDIVKKTDSNPLTVSKNVRNLVSELNETYGSSFEFIIIMDLSDQLVESMKQLLLSLLCGIIITISILFIFLKNIRLSFLVASVMPLSILSSVLVLCIFKRSLNVISISGMAIGIGMVIDSSIILVENSIKNFSLNAAPDIKKTVYKSAEEIYRSSVGSTVTTVIVFIPLFFLQGLTGKLFSDLAVSVISSISFSCILSLTYIPAVLVFVFSHADVTDIKSSFIQKAEKCYSSFLIRVFQHKRLIPFMLISVFLLTFLLIRFIPVEIMPDTHTSNMSVEIMFDEKSSYDYLKENEKYLSNYLKQNQNFKWYSITGGIDEDAYEQLIRPDVKSGFMLINCCVQNIHEAEAFFAEVLMDKDVSYKIVRNKNILNQILDTDMSSYIICGANEGELESKLLENKVEQYYPFSSVHEYVFEPDRNLCARYNISTSQTSQIAKETLDGVDAGFFFSEGKKIPVKVKYDKNVITNPQQLLETKVSVSDVSLPLSALGNFEFKKSEKIFYRYNRKDAKIANFIDQKINDENIISPNRESIKELTLNAVFLLCIVIVLLYCVMGAQFESFSIPVLMMLALPPAFTGAFLFLFLFRQSININSIIALVILFGTSVNNSIILYEGVQNADSINEKSIIQNCTGKIRSILITTLTSICALIPFAVDPLHKNAQSSLSVAIIGGLIFSFVIVLSVMPVIFSETINNDGIDKC